MTDAELKRVIEATLAADREHQRRTIDSVIDTAIERALERLGIDLQDRDAIKKDFNHLRRWRISIEQAGSYTTKAIITAIAGGFIGALWLGIKSILALKS